MINRYTYNDPIFKVNTKYKNLRIESENEILYVFRLISGTINCADSYKNKNYKFRINYSNFPYSQNSTINQSTVLNNFPDEVKLQDLDRYFKKSKFNAGFYKSIKAELIKCLIAEQMNNHLEAFFYLYRIIEGISYTIPLIFVSKNKSYDKTYKQLQTFFNKQQDGELAFFKRFVSSTFKDEDFFKSTIDINILEIDIEEIQEDYYKIYLEKMNEVSIKEKSENQEIRISFIGFYEFMIELRNRFFHFTKGSWMDNLSSTELMFPDYFFKPIVKHGINWVSIILLEIIKVDFTKGEN